MSTVFSIEPLGITRACATPPSIRTNARTTQNQETTSAQRRDLRSCGAAFASVADGELPAACCLRSRFTMRSYFQLDELGGIYARVARRTELFVGIADRSANGF